MRAQLAWSVGQLGVDRHLVAWLLQDEARWGMAPVTGPLSCTPHQPRSHTRHPFRRLLPSAPGVERARRLLRLVLQALSPHFCLARGVHLVSGGSALCTGVYGCFGQSMPGQCTSTYCWLRLSLATLPQVGQTYQPDRLAAHLSTALSAAGLLGSGSNSSSSSGGSSNAGAGAEMLGPFGPELGEHSPWAWDVSGELLAWLAGQALLYGSAVLLIETGTLWRRAKAAWLAWGGSGSGQPAGYQHLAGQEPGAAVAVGSAAAGPVPAADAPGRAEAGEAAAEDPDVAAERRAVQSGRLPPASVAVLLQGVSKTYWQPAGGRAQHVQERHGQEQGGPGHGHSGTVGSSVSGGGGGAVHAVRDLWLGIGRHEPPARLQQAGGSGSGGARGGECFGLLGVNGAGKTTTWRMVTGEQQLLP